MNIKRLIYNMLFNERQRKAIWQAVLFSEHTYKRRGNVDGAAHVRQVINEVAKIAATKQAVYLESQVAEIVKHEVEAALKGSQAKIEAAYKEGKTAGVKKTLDEVKQILDDAKKRTKPFTIDTAKCEKCDEADNCFIYQAILEVERGDENEAEEKDDADNNENAEREIPVEGAEAAQDTDGADAPEVDEDREEDKDKAEGE